MAKNDRKTLKGYFENGKMPDADHFSNLIDSMLNIMDDGFDRSPEDGIKIAQISESGKSISFYRHIGDPAPLWSIRVDDDNNLVFSDKDNPSVLFLDGQNSRVGINKKPEREPDVGGVIRFDVGGVIRSEGRIGVAGTEELAAPANGEWHDITDELNGCQAFEVMAGVGKKKEGKYALIHAFALNVYNPKGLFFNFLNLKKRIRFHQAYYRSRSDKLKLRWRRGEGHEYWLQIKSNSNYEDDIKIQYYITKLWFDADMSESWENASNLQPQPPSE